MDPIQIKVDKVSGYIVLALGCSFLWTFIYPLFPGNSGSKHVVVYIYSLLMILACVRKGYVLIRDAGNPASAGILDNQLWPFRVMLVFMLLIIYFIFVLGLMGDDGIALFIVGFPLTLSVL
jgi:hypothetical protein